MTVRTSSRSCKLGLDSFLEHPNLEFHAAFFGPWGKRCTDLSLTLV